MDHIFPRAKNAARLGGIVSFLYPELLGLLVLADLVGNAAAGLASGLAGSLTFTAAFEFDGVLQRRLVDCNDVFRHNVTS